MESLGWALELAGRVGFARAAAFAPSGLTPLAEVRGLCAPERCGHFGRSWSCLTAAEAPEALEERLAQYRAGLLVQSVSAPEPGAGAAELLEAHRVHRERLHSLAHLLRGDFPGCLPLASGPCDLCPVCACPDAPCRHPDRAAGSLEAWGLWVSSLCRQAGLDYCYGPDTLTFSGCILLP